MMVRIKIKLRTPDNVTFGHNTSSIDNAGSVLTSEFKKNKKWTEVCSDMMKDNPLLLYRYDKMEFSLGNAFGDTSEKIALNPMMVHCLHPACVKKGKTSIKLRKMFAIKPFLLHLMDHHDSIGKSMTKRFEAISSDPLISMEKLDLLSPSPSSLIDRPIIFKDNVTQHYENFAIDRKLKVSYICHWKDKLLKAKLLDSSSLSFQEDDALVSIALYHPIPIPDWMNWRTLFFYGLKMFTSISATCLNLYRGITEYCNLAHGPEPVPELKEFIKKLNHPSPSLTSYHRFLPCLNFDKEQFHKGELMFHLKLLEKFEQSIKISFDLITRYPIVLGIDEQEINAGTFIAGNKLQGLSKSLSVDDLKRIGLQNLGHHIALNNHFISSVREYHISDFSGSLCSNVFTSFESKALNTRECTTALKNVVKLSKQCLFCLKNNDDDCVYARLDSRCNKCVAAGLKCISMVVFLVLWDMGSSHKSTARTIEKIYASSNEDFMNSNLFSIAFGGLHLAKCLVNALRCFSLSNEGSNFGLYILRAIRNEDEDDEASFILSFIKNAVFVGKDRQSDYLSYSTCQPRVVNALKKKECYSLIRVPEQILDHTKNAKTQMEIINPVSIGCNLNGDIFVLDQGGSCLHVYNRSDVTKETVIGKYRQTYTLNVYDKEISLVAADIKFSSSLEDMVICKDNVFISDSLYQLVFILRGCKIANSVPKSSVFALDDIKCSSMTFVDEMLLVLITLDDDIGFGFVIKGLNLTVPISNSSNKNSFYLTYQVNFFFAPKYAPLSLFRFSYNGYSFGVQSKDKELFFYKKEGEHYTQSTSNVESAITPCLYEDGILFTSTSGNYLMHSIYNPSTEEFGLPTKLDENYKPSIVSVWGSTVYFVAKKGDQFVLIEYGKLEFSIAYCEAVQNLYRSICYVPPHGDKSILPHTVMQSIEIAESTKYLLHSMQSTLEKKFFPRKSFNRENGIPSSDTIDCLNITIEGWKAVVERVNFLCSGLHRLISPHTLTNESIVEHKFGFCMKKGQGHLQTVEEYVHSKRRNSLEFQLRMCDAPFNQYVKVKLRDKGYQELNPALKSKLDLDDLKEIFSVSLPPEKEDDLSGEDEKLLKQFYSRSKSVPRQTNRCKWRESSGYAPNLLQNYNTGMLMSGDLVFLKLVHEITIFKILYEAVLTNKSQFVKVVQVHPSNSPPRTMKIRVKTLKHYRGKLAIIPSYLYCIKDNSVDFSDVAKELIDEMFSENSSNSDTDTDSDLDQDS